MFDEKLIAEAARRLSSATPQAVPCLARRAGGATFGHGVRKLKLVTWVPIYTRGAT